MEIPTEIVTVMVTAGAAIGGGVLWAGKAGLAWLAKRAATKAAGVAGDHELKLPGAPASVRPARVMRLEAASVHARCKKAAASGADACVKLVTELADEAAREECAGCTKKQAIIDAVQADRITELKDVLPALERGAQAADRSAEASDRAAASGDRIAAAVTELVIELRTRRDER